MPRSEPRSQQPSALQRSSTLPSGKLYGSSSSSDRSYPPSRRSDRLSSKDYDDYTYNNNDYYYAKAGRRQQQQPKQGGGRRSSLAQRFAPPNPLPQYADPEQRAYRKKKEKEAGGFSWEDGLTLALTAAAAAFSIDKTLKRAHEEAKGSDVGGRGRESRRGPRGKRREDSRKASEGVARPRAPVSSGAPKEDWYYESLPGGGIEDYDGKRPVDAGEGRTYRRSGTW